MLKSHSSAILLPLLLGVTLALVSGCSDPECGDGVAEGSEACDDGNTYSDDGCSPSCFVENGWTCADGLCDSVCGDFATVAGEVCDPTDSEWMGYCSNDCMEITGSCGDDIIQSEQEDCEDGNSIVYDGCTGCREDYGSTCTSTFPSSCTGSGIPTSTTLGSLVPSQNTTYCRWISTLLGGAGHSFQCGSLIWTVASVSECSSNIAGGWGANNSCTIGDLEEAVARAGTACGVMEISAICN